VPGILDGIRGATGGGRQVTQPQVLAARAGGSAGYRRAWITEQLRERFWVLPGLLLVLGAVLAALTVQARHLGLPVRWLGELPVDPGEASSVLGIIASSTLTFLGVVFTLTLVALQLASSQLSPRVLRMFVRSGITKIAFGILLATFSFSVTFLALNGGRGHEADSRGITVAIALVSASLVVFIGYVARTMKLLQVAWVITAVADETRAAIAQHFPPVDRYVLAAPAALSGARTIVQLAGIGSRPGRRSFGVLQAVDRDRLCELARHHDCVLELLVRIGEYVPTGGTVMAVYGAPPPASAVLASLHLGRTRTLYQDPAFGIRQLADIAIQALSPAVNQPTTASQVIDRLEDILLRIARSPSASGQFADRRGQVRFVEPPLSWDTCVDLAFTEITSYGAGSAQVARRLLAAYDALERCEGGERAAGLRSRRAGLVEQFGARADGHGVLHADAMGLG
jgi:uncharacterized membrane protein